MRKCLSKIGYRQPLVYFLLLLLNYVYSDQSFSPPLPSHGYQLALEYQVSGTLGASTTEADSGAQIGEKGLKASSVVGDRLLFLHEDPAEQVIHISIHPCALVGSSVSVMHPVGFLVVSLAPCLLPVLPLFHRIP